MKFIRNVLIDTDADFDDYMAMLYLLKNPSINVEGITVTGTGDAHLTPGVRNINNMLTLLDDPQALTIPVAAGAKAPMIYSNTFPYTERQAANDHYDAPFHGTNPIPHLNDALAFLREYLINCENPVTILCIGGGSNWGRLFALAKTDTELRLVIDEKVDEIVMMGGNLLPCYISPGIEGNIQATMQPYPYYTNKVAEWNIFVDPLGAEEIFSSNVPLTLIALNATSKVPITSSFVDDLREINNSVSNFLCKVLDSDTIKPGIDSYLDFWDPLAACVLVNPTLVSTKCFRLRVELELNEEDDKSGMLIVDDVKGHNINVALNAKTTEVYQEYLRIIAL